jgi:hypothetical protein
MKEKIGRYSTSAPKKLPCSHSENIVNSKRMGPVKKRDPLESSQINLREETYWSPLMVVAPPIPSSAQEKDMAVINNL